MKHIFIFIYILKFIACNLFQDNTIKKYIAFLTFTAFK